MSAVPPFLAVAPRPPFRAASVRRRFSRRWAAALAAAVLLALLAVPALTAEAAAPTVPQNVTVTAGYRSLTVTWDAPTSADATSYAVQYKLSTATDWTTVSRSDFAALTETFTIANSQFKSYDARVQAVNSDGVSDWVEAGPATPNMDLILTAAPAGIWLNFSSMYVLDNQTQTQGYRPLRAFRLLNGAPDPSGSFLETIQYSTNTSSAGICRHDTLGWLVGDYGHLSAYEEDFFTGTLAPAPSSDIDLEGTSNRGVWCDFDRILVAVDGTVDVVRAYTFTFGPFGGVVRRAPDQDIMTLSASGNENPWGVWSDGDTVWVGDTADDKLYAYGSDGRRRSGLDLDTLGSRHNNDPVGILGAAGTGAMWVADSADNRIYSYPLPLAEDDGPEAWSADVSSDGTSVAITFDEPLDTDVTPTAARFSVTVGSNAAVVPSAVAHTTGNSRSFTLTLASAAQPGEPVSIAYTDPSGDDTTDVVQDVDGNDLPSFTALAATPRPFTTFVSNLEEFDSLDEFDIFVANSHAAQAFTTGSHTGGYQLNSVDVRLAFGAFGPQDVPALAIFSTNDEGDPDAQVYGLINPGSLITGQNRFTAPSNAILEADTTYFLVIQQDSGSDGFQVESSHSDLEYPTPAPGWSIANDARERTPESAWYGSFLGSIKLAVTGAVVDPALVPGLPTGLMVSGGDRQLTVSWTVPATGATVSEYVVQYKRSSDSNWMTVNRTDVTAVTETISGLRNQQAFQVRVRALSGIYKGAWTSASSGSTTGTVGTVATLSQLSLSNVTLNAAFAPGTTSYTGTAALTTHQSNLTATATDQYAEVEVLDGSDSPLADVDTETDGYQLSLLPGPNTIKVRVTSENEMTTTAYTVVVTRAVTTVSIGPDPRVTENQSNEGTFAQFRISRADITDDPLDVTVMVSEDGSKLRAGEGGERTFTIPGGAEHGRVLLRTENDQAYEPHTTVTAVVVASSRYNIDATKTSATTQVLDNDFPAATAVLSVRSPGVQGLSALATVTVTTTNDQEPHGAAGSFLLSTTPGTADESDYTPLTRDRGLVVVRGPFTQDPVTRRWSASESAPITITIDGPGEPSEYFTVSMAKERFTLFPTAPAIRLGTSSARVTINRDLGTSADLTGLTLSHGTLDPPFMADLVTYEVSVPFSVEQITLRPTKDDANAGIEWGNVQGPLEDASSAAGFQVDLGYGLNQVNIVVVAESSSPRETYHVFITRELPVVTARLRKTNREFVEGDGVFFDFTLAANLPGAPGDQLAVHYSFSESGGDHFPSVWDSDHSYLIGVGSRSGFFGPSSTNDDIWEPHSTVTFTLLERDDYTIGGDNPVSRMVLDDDFPEATATLSLSTTTANENDMDGPNAGDTVTATVTVTTARNEEPHENGGSIRLTLGADDNDATEDASSSDYTIMGSTTLSFPRSEFTHITAENVYRLSKTVEIKIVNDNAKERDELFTVTMNRVPSGSGQTDSAITFDSTATTHTVTIPQSDRSSDASLQSLSLSAGGPLSPGFSAGTTEYTAAVPFGDTQITLNPRRSEPNSTLTYLDSADATLADASASAGFQVDLPLNTPFVVKMRVVAEDESTERTYTLTIMRQLPQLTISMSDTSDLAEGGTLVATVTRNGTTDETTDFSMWIVDEFNTMTDAADVGTKNYTIAADTDSIEISVSTISDDDWDEHSQLSLELLSGLRYMISGEPSVSRRVIDDDFPEATAVLTLHRVIDAPIVMPGVDLIPEGGRLIALVTVETVRNEQPHEDGGHVFVRTDDGPDPDGDCETCTKVAATAGDDYQAVSGNDGRVNFSASGFGQVGTAPNQRWQSFGFVNIVTIDDDVDEFGERFTVSIRRRSTGLYTTHPKITIPDATVDLTTALRSQRASYVDIDRSDLADDPALGAIAFMSGSLSVGSLGEEFHPDTTSYPSATVPFSFPQITLVPNTRSDAATIQYLDAADMTLADAGTGAGFQVDLPENEGKVVKIKVTAQDESATRTYTVTILRRRPVASISVTGTEEPEGDEITYTVSLDGPVEVAAGVDVLVDVDGANVVESAGQKTVTVAMGNDSATLIVPTVDDDLWEEHTPVTATIVPGTNYRLSEVEAEVAATLTVQDDDFPDAVAVLRVNPNPVAEPPASPAGVPTGTPSEISVQVTITTDRDEAPREGAGGIQLSTSDGTAVAGSDYSALTASQGLLRFNLGDFAPVDAGGSQRYQATQTVTIPITHDNEEEDAEDFTVAMALIPDGEPQESDSRLSLGSGESTTVTIAANDAHRVVDVVAQPTSGGANITVRLSNPTQRLMTLYLDITRYYFDGTQPQDIPLGAFGQRETTGIVDQFSLSDLGVELYDATLFVAAAHGPSELGEGDTFTTLGAGPAVSQVGSANVTQTGAQAEVLLINLETGAGYVVRVRFREVGASIAGRCPIRPRRPHRRPGSFLTCRG